MNKSMNIFYFYNYFCQLKRVLGALGCISAEARASGALMDQQN